MLGENDVCTMVLRATFMVAIFMYQITVGSKQTKDIQLKHTCTLMCSHTTQLVEFHCSYSKLLNCAVG